MRFALSIICLGFFVNTYSQLGQQLHYRFQHLNRNNGLAGESIIGMAQDDKGFMWMISFYDGIQRYDGVRFQDFSDKFEGVGKDGIVFEALRSVNGRLYIRSNGDDYTLNSFRTRFIKSELPDQSKPGLVFWDEKGMKWELFADRLICYTNKNSGEKPTELRLYEGLKGVSSNLIFDSVRQQYWYCETDAIRLFDLKSGKAYSSTGQFRHTLFQFLRKRNKYIYSAMVLDKDLNLWIARWGGLFRYNLKTEEIKEYVFPDSSKSLHLNQKDVSPFQVNSFFLDHYGQLWLATYGKGLLKYNKKKDAFDYVLSSREDPFSIRYNFEIFSLYQDDQDNIWVGTDNGISIFNPYHDFFRTIAHDPANPNSLPRSEIQVLLQVKNGDIWIGTWGGGITVFDSAFNFKSHLLFAEISANLVWGLIEDTKSNVWVTSQAGLINRINPITKAIDSTFFLGSSRSTIRSVLKDASGNIFFGLHNGKVIKLLASQNKIAELNYQKSVNVTKPIINLFTDEKQNIWASNLRGIYKLDTEKMIFTDSFFTSPERKFSTMGLVSSRFNDSSILLSNLNGGGGYFNAETKTFRPWNFRDKLQAARISAIKTDHNGNIWFTSGFGIYYFAAGREREVNSIAIPEGMLHSAFMPTPIISLKDGNWASATSTEYVIFNPENLIKRNIKNKPVTISGLKIFENQFLIDSFLIKGLPVVLNHNQNFISIEFSPLTYNAVNTTKYAYKLSGIDENWVMADGSLSAEYTNLKPGEYTFSVRPDGSLDEDAIKTFRFIITPPLWKTWWFYSFLILSGLVITVMGIRRRIKTIRIEANLNQKVLETEMAALRAQMNPHFIFNCLSAIDNLIQNDERDRATSYLARFARLIRNVLESSKNNVIPFYKDFETIQLFIDLERFRSNGKFSYQLQADQELLNGDYKVPPMLVQPFIENAIHHGLFNKEEGDKHLRVDAKLDKDFIVYTISDNGVGRKKAEELKNINRPAHMSYGIRISQERIKNFNRHLPSNKLGNVQDKDLVVTDLKVNGECAGTEVKLRLKINSNI